MRHYLLALLLLLLCATPSSAQPARPDTLVCFTLDEAGLIHDTLWSAANHRRSRAIYAGMLSNLRLQLKGCEEREALERTRATLNAQVMNDAAARCSDVEEWRRKARQRGRLFGGGLVLGGAVTFLLTELW
jgi:hypothetical protein